MVKKVPKAAKKDTIATAASDRDTKEIRIVNNAAKWWAFMYWLWKFPELWKVSSKFRFGIVFLCAENMWAAMQTLSSGERYCDTAITKWIEIYYSGYKDIVLRQLRLIKDNFENMLQPDRLLLTKVKSRLQALSQYKPLNYGESVLEEVNHGLPLLFSNIHEAAGKALRTIRDSEKHVRDLGFRAPPKGTSKELISTDDESDDDSVSQEDGTVNTENGKDANACAQGGAGTTQKEDPGYVISLRSGKKTPITVRAGSDRITISRSPRRGLTKLAIDGAQHSHDKVRSENHTHKRAPDAEAKAQQERMMAPEARTTLTR
ncbi:unnamed protein product [Trichogramma brassicae]|uniref:Uncharacterized protein n=1 Tax=Trichogramma brassicae TaxID=86971 RepID=A0A6H5J1K1_9HYME|nr:unnamed protein product [Trichogramma brassicae]